MSFESVANSPKSRHCCIAVKSNGHAGSMKSSGFYVFSDESVFQVHIAQLVSVLLR